MLLETLDIKKEDVIIYSKNLFNLEKNFRRIQKDDPYKTPYIISYSDVCKYVNEFTPKNLIVYRLMTNIKDFKINQSHYGFFININGITELIYFDPVFAVKELEEFAERLSEYDMRFRIQQVGLTTLNRKGALPNYSEIYSIDLEADEAKNQDDSVYVEAILAKTKKPKKKKEKSPKKATKEYSIPQHTTTIPDEEEKGNKQEDKKKEKKPLNVEERGKDIKLKHYNISEDEDFDYKQLLRMNYKEKTVNQAIAESGEYENKPRVESKPKAEKKVEETKKSLSSFIKGKQSNEVKEKARGEISETPKAMTEIFKSSSSLKKHLKGKEDKKIVLKLTKNI